MIVQYVFIIFLYNFCRRELLLKNKETRLSLSRSLPFSENNQVEATREHDVGRKMRQVFFPIVISHFPHRLLMPVSLIPCALDTSCDCCNILWFINVFIRHDRLSDFCYFSVTSLCSIMNCRGDSSASLRDIMSPPDDVEICY